MEVSPQNLFCSRSRRFPASPLPACRPSAQTRSPRSATASQATLLMGELSSTLQDTEALKLFVKDRRDRLRSSPIQTNERSTHAPRFPCRPVRRRSDVRSHVASDGRTHTTCGNSRAFWGISWRSELYLFGQGGGRPGSAGPAVGQRAQKLINDPPVSGARIGRGPRALWCLCPPRCRFEGPKLHGRSVRVPKPHRSHGGWRVPPRPTRMGRMDGPHMARGLPPKWVCLRNSIHGRVPVKQIM